MELQESYLLKLQEVLRVKNFSNPVKQHIRTTLSKVYELDIENKEEHLFSIIEGLKKVEKFKINTRENLLKIKCVKDYLTPTAMGFVTSSSDLVAVVKNEYDIEVNYHELVHLSQNEKSYHIDEKYGFSNLFQYAMKEGEAVYYEMKLLEKEYPKTMSNGKITLFSYHSMTYRIFLELYQDMRNLLGQSLLEKWKQGDSKDIMLELEEYMIDNYEIDFSVIYKTWKGLLYHFCIREDDEKIQLAKQDYKNQEKNHQINADSNQILSSQITSYRSSIEESTARLIEINNMLENEIVLNNSFLEKLSQTKKELSEYISEYGEDQVAKEWKEEIENITVEDYKNSLISEKIENENSKKQNQENLSKTLKEKTQVDWIESFYFPISNFSLEELADFKDLEMMNLKEKSNKLKNKKFLSNVLYYGNIHNKKQKTEDHQMTEYYK